MAARGSRSHHRHNADIGIIAVADDCPQGENRLRAVQAPPGPSQIEAVGYEVTAGSLDDPGRDRPARGQGPVVAQELALVSQVADARVGAGAVAAFQSGGVGFGGDPGGGPVAVAGQHHEGLHGDPVLGGGIPGLVEAPGSAPYVLKHVNYVYNYVNGDAAAGGLSADQAQLMLGAVDQDDPGPQVDWVAGPGLVEHRGDHVCRVLADGPGQPLRQGFRPGPERAAAGPAAGRGDHVVRPARCGLGVVDGDQGGHPLAVRLLPGREPGPHLPQFRGGLRGGRPERAGPHHDALAAG